MWQKGQTPVPGYKLEKFLGRGNFGEVWQSTSPGGTKCALKFLNLQEKQGRKEFRALQPLKQIRHANLMPLNAMWLLDEHQELIPDDDLDTAQPIMEDSVRKTLDVGAVISDSLKPQTLVIAMPLAEGNLLELSEERRSEGKDIPIEELLVYMMDAARALDFLNAPKHEMGSGLVAVQHGDVKPENLVLLGGSVVLCDFGVARTLGGGKDSRGTSLGGSWAYIAPECLEGQISSHSDQFSLAISYVELRTGKLPFPEDSVAQVIADRKQGKLWLDDLEPEERRIIRRACAVNPEKRYASNVEMVEALRAALMGNGGKKSKASLLPIAASALLLSVAGILAWFSWFKDSDPSPTPLPSTTGSEAASGPQLYAQAVSILQASDRGKSGLADATRMFVKALQAGFEAEVPEPKRIGIQLNRSTSRYNLTDLRAVTALFAVHPETQRVIVVGDDGRSLDELSRDGKGKSLPLKITSPIASLHWLDEIHVLVRDCASDLHRIRLDDGESQKVAHGVLRVASAPLSKQAIAISEEDGAKNSRLMLIDATDIQELPTAAGEAVYSPLITIDSSAQWAVIDEELDPDGMTIVLQLDSAGEQRVKNSIKPFCMTSQRILNSTYTVIGGQSRDVAAGFALLHLGRDSNPVISYGQYSSELNTSSLMVGNNNTVRSLATVASNADPARSLLATGHEANLGTATTELWDIDSSGTARFRGTVGSATAESISAIAFDPRGQWIVRGTEYGAVVLNKIGDESDFHLMTVDYEADVIQLQISGSYLVCAFDDASVLVWDFDECRMVYEACKIEGRPFPRPKSSRPLEG